MSPLARTLLALACATLLHSATCSKRKCANTTIGKLPISIRRPMKLHLNFNKTGTYETSVNIKNLCQSWPGDYKLLYEEVTVCNDDGWTVKIDPPKSDTDFSPIEVRCFVTIFNLDVPCFFWNYNMNVKVTQYCTDLHFLPAKLARHG